MTKGLKPTREPSSATALHSISDYEVGYRKPPTATQFRAGRSGNPKGRPRGTGNRRADPDEERLKSIILEEAYRTIKVNEGQKQITLPMAQAVVRALAVNAARGQLRSQQAFTALLSETERSNRAQYNEWLKAAIEYKQNWEDELERRKQSGVTGPEPLPHPDDIIIDLRANSVVVKGPITREEKAEWDRLRAKLDECDVTINELNAELKLGRNQRHQEFLRDDLMHEMKIRKIIADAIGEPKRRNSG